MNLRQHKVWLATGVAILLVLLVLLLTSRGSSSSAVRLTFLYTTNNPQVGKVGVFELVNQLPETVVQSIGHYKPANRSGFNTEVGDLGARIFGAHQFAAGTTNILKVSLPTNRGPFKLVLMCFPASKATPQFNRSVRSRIAALVSPWVHPSFATQARWYGAVFTESQSFETSP
jgi:hypothetical protein